MSKKRLIPVITLLIIISCFRNSEGLKKSDIPSLVNQFLAMHVKYHTLNDELSARILDNLILSLDWGKYYFYKKDIDGFNAKYRTKIDDFITNGQFGFLDEIFTLYRKRVDESNKLLNELLKGKFDFNVDEKIIVDRDKVDYADSREDMRDRWRKNVKLQLLNYLSSDQSID